MTTYLAVRDGQVKMPLPNPTIKADGTIWLSGNPLLDSESAGAREIGIDKLRSLAKSKAWDKIPLDAWAKIGLNPSGLLVIEQAEYISQQRAARTPAQVERDRINGLYAKAYQRRDARDDCNTMDYYRIKADADAALAKWRENYPVEAKAEHKAKLLADAGGLRDKAIGALTYDADGWLSREDQKKRHDEFITQAEAIEAKANNL